MCVYGTNQTYNKQPYNIQQFISDSNKTQHVTILTIILLVHQSQPIVR